MYEFLFANEKKCHINNTVRKLYRKAREKVCKKIIICLNTNSIKN